MVDKIYESKNKVVEYMGKLLERGVENVNLTQLGAMADVVKDLAEAYEKCWKAEYYRSAVESSKKSGYSGGTGSSTSYRGYDGSMRQGYDQGMQRQGYNSMSGHTEVDTLIQKMDKADPAERERILNELRMKIGM
jgi:hypothetical protein